MTTTLQSIVDDARRMLDVAAQSHYTDAELSRYAVEGMRRLYALAPSSRYGENGSIDDQNFPTAPDPLSNTASQEARTTNAEAIAAALAFEVRINEPRWRIGIVYYAAGRAHEVGITDAVNLQMAATLKKQADEIFMA